MRFGLSLSGMLQHSGDGDMVQRFQDCIHLVQVARELGFDYIYAGHHFLSHPYQTLQPLPALARLSAEAGHMDILSTVLVSIANPVQLAEEVATLDVITGGKMTIAAALGYRDVEYEAFGVKKDERISRMFETLDLMHQLWKGEEVNFTGKFHQVTRAHVGVKPIQRPPRVWIAANGDRMIRRIAAKGYTWYLNPHAEHKMLAEQLAAFRAIRSDAGHPDPDLIPMGRECFVGITDESATKIARPFLESKYQTYAAWGQDKAWPGEQDFQQPFEKLAAGRFIVGGPQRVQEDLEYFRGLGITDVSLRFGWPGMPMKLVEESIQLAASRIFPSLRE